MNGPLIRWSLIQFSTGQYGYLGVSNRRAVVIYRVRNLWRLITDDTKVSLNSLAEAQSLARAWARSDERNCLRLKGIRGVRCLYDT